MMKSSFAALALLLGLAHAAVTVRDSANLHLDSPAIQLTAEFALVSLARTLMTKRVFPASCLLINRVHRTS